MSGRIVTLTLNPSLDIGGEAEAVAPTRKIRLRRETLDPGGGGVNVARVVRALGGEALAVVASGGPVGAALEQALRDAGVPCRAVPVRSGTRIALVVQDRATGEEYRFIPEGPALAEAEWRAVLRAAAEKPGPWLVLSGSLPRGVPDDALAIALREAKARGQRVAVDASGPALAAALAEGGAALLKPSRGEFAALMGRDPGDAAAIAREALALARGGAAALIAVTLGHAGAVLAAAAGGCWFLPAPEVEVRGASGAGDSFMAAMVLALVEGASPEEAFCRGAAAGGATVAAAGTAHATREAMEAILPGVRAGLRAI